MAFRSMAHIRFSSDLVRKASGEPLKKSKEWLRDGGVHDIPVQLLVKQERVSRLEFKIYQTHSWLRKIGYRGHGKNSRVAA